MKSKSRGRSLVNCHKLPTPVVLLLCLACFLAGFYGSTFVSQDTFVQKHDLALKGRKSLEVIQEEVSDVMEHGKNGDAYISDIPFQVLSWHPRALLFRNFATKEQCESIVALAKTRLSPSSLALRKGESEENTKDTRTSSGTFLTSKQDKSGSLRWVEEKMARATMVPVSHGEAFNVLRYEIGQKYNSHYDYFNPAEYGPQTSQRGYQNMKINYDYKRCIGLKVKPRQGDALLFYSMHPNGTFDRASLHGSCPVIKGEKWVATKWIRDQDRW